MPPCRTTRWERSVLSFTLAACLGCGGASPSSPQSAGATRETTAPVDAGPPPPCAALGADEASRVIGPPPDNARANVSTLENLPAKAAELEGTLVRTQGTIETIGADGTWLVLHDPLFDGWGVVVIRDERVRVPAGARGCVAKVEGLLERVALDEREAAMQREQGRPEESFSEDGNEPHLVLVGIELRKP